MNSNSIVLGLGCYSCGNGPNPHVVQHTFGPIDEFTHVDIQLLAWKRKGHAKWIVAFDGGLLTLSVQELFDPVSNPCEQLLARTLLQCVGDGPLVVNDLKSVFA
jgi:hypothetical protein